MASRCSHIILICQPSMNSLSPSMTVAFHACLRNSYKDNSALYLSCKYINTSKLIPSNERDLLGILMYNYMLIEE